MTNFSDNVQKALGYLRSNGINMIYISDNTDLSEDYPDGFIFIKYVKNTRDFSHGIN